MSNQSNSDIDIYKNAREFTLRAVLLGLIATATFTASNLYLSLKVGLSIASSIPAAVISMAIFRSFKDNNILENNIVQTIVSSAGTLTAVIFVLPALLITGYWAGFDYWYTLGICVTGGTLGVMFSIPLRRAMIVESDLRFPEGVAAAEILKVGSRQLDEEKLAHDTDPTDIEHGSKGITELVIGTGVGAVFKILQDGFKFIGEEVSVWVNLNGRIFGMGTGITIAIIAAGYLAGMNAGISFLIGTAIAWLIALPAMFVVDPSLSGDELMKAAYGFWAKDIRFIGVGAMAVAALWTLVILMKPIAKGLKSSFVQMQTVKKSSYSAIKRTDFDLPIHYVILVSLILMIPLFHMFKSTLLEEPLALSGIMIIQILLICTVFTFIFGFLLSAAAGYMAGLAGSSNSPISGLSITCILCLSFLLYWFVGKENLMIPGSNNMKGLMGLILFVSSVVLSIACIANDNLQDLKTGQLVQATPYKQQLALVIGVIIGAIVIPPILNLLHEAYGFVGAIPRADMDPSVALAAPQANLAAVLIQAIFNDNLNWPMIQIGMGVAVFFIILDMFLTSKNPKYSIPVLGVGMGIYLPFTIGMPLFLGSLFSWIVNRRIASNAKKIASANDKETYVKVSEKKGMLIASGFIVGESLIGILMAILIVSTGSQTPLALMPASFTPTANILAALLIFAIGFWSYRHITSKGK